jgi:hypothetical protein
MRQDKEQDPKDWALLTEDEKAKLRLLEDISAEEAKALMDLYKIPHDKILMLCTEIMYHAHTRNDMVLFEQNEIIDFCMIMINSLQNINREKIKTILQTQDALPKMVWTKLMTMHDPN